ncbi:MAG: hypothetical protein MUC89_03445 [Acetobacteraceae bacterium]|jgi:hypothetical protein|nr:hypothetical protein [Acetobacteraceae bacterium]
MRNEQRAGTRPAMALLAIAACLWPEVASADPPWRRGHHHGQSWGGGWYGNGHGWHREHRGRHQRPIIVVPPPAYRPPPVVVIPGYAVPYGYGRGWGYAPYGGEAEFRLRLPIR